MTLKHFFITLNNGEAELIVTSEDNCGDLVLSFSATNYLRELEINTSHINHAQTNEK